MKTKTIYQIIIVILITILLLQFCTKRKVKPEYTDERKIENAIKQQTIIRFKDSIRFTDSTIYSYKTIRTSISESNANALQRYKDVHMDSLNVNRSVCDTLVEGLVTEIDISDTIIELQNKTIHYRDSVINNLEIINLNFKSMLSEIETKLVKSNKKVKRKNIFLIITSSIAAIVTLILIAG